jgi:hypothetical protein
VPEQQLKSGAVRRKQLRAHTQRFAFRAPEEDDESVKMSNTTRGRSSALPPALLASRSGPKRAKNGDFYSIQMAGFLLPRILQPTENKALHFFYSIQMKRQALITNYRSPLTITRSIP